jgi:hypothetical protein
MSAFMICYVLFAESLAAGAPADRPAGPPLTLSFLRKSGPAPGHKEAYDPRTRAYYLHVHDIARFQIKAVAPNLEKRPVILHISGMLDNPEGPLMLSVPAGPNEQPGAYPLGHKGHDRKLFRIQRKDGVTTIEFLPAGKRLLKAGATFQYIDAYRR